MGKTAFIFLTRNAPEFQEMCFSNSKLEDFFIVGNNNNDELISSATSAGFKNATLKEKTGKECTAWEMALYLACLSKYESVWLIEDDVFFTAESKLLELEEKCNGYDLCVPAHKYKSDDILDWHWPKVKGKIERPWYYSMTCAVRLSRKMLNLISEYAEHNGELFFHEVMFNTLAAQNKLTVYCPPELKTILWQCDWTLEDYLYLPNNLFHPVKLFDAHKNIRAIIKFAQHHNYKPNVGRVPMFIRQQ